MEPIRIGSELPLACISDMDSANESLYGGFLEELNSKFAVEPREEGDFHPSAKEYDLRSIFSIEEERRIGRDSIVQKTASIN